MPYMKRLTVSEAVRFGGVGIMSFSLAYALAMVAERVNKITRNRIEGRRAVRIEGGSSKRFVDRWVNFCLDHYQRILDRILVLTKILFSVIALLFWHAGTLLTFYAVIGPLLY